jgi:hypothetical protein
VTPRGPVVIEANNWWAPFTALPSEAWELVLAGWGCPGMAGRRSRGRDPRTVDAVRRADVGPSVTQTMGRAR